MQLQGKDSKNLPKEDIEKKKETLADMETIRKEDSIQLRQKSIQKITWLKEQIQKADEVEYKLREQLEQIKAKRLRIEGALTVLQNLLEDK